MTGLGSRPASQREREARDDRTPALVDREILELIRLQAVLQPRIQVGPVRDLGGRDLVVPGDVDIGPDGAIAIAGYYGGDAQFGIDDPEPVREPV